MTAHRTIDDLEQAVLDDCNRGETDDAKRIWPDGLSELVSLAKEGSRLALRVALVDLDELRALVRDEITAGLGADREVCICAAIQLKNAVGGTVVIRGHRHHDCIAAVRLRLSTSHKEVDHEAVRQALHCSEQGFITSRNRFVGRAEGMQLQLAAGIPSAAEGGYRGTLFSEDLY